MSKKGPIILLLASPIAGAVVFEESGVQGEKHWGDQIQEYNTTQKNEEAQRLYQKQLIYSK
jgi:hypothetical protein